MISAGAHYAYTNCAGNKFKPPFVFFIKNTEYRIRMQPQQPEITGTGGGDAVPRQPPYPYYPPHLPHPYHLQHQPPPATFGPQGVFHGYACTGGCACGRYHYAPVYAQPQQAPPARAQPQPQPLTYSRVAAQAMVRRCIRCRDCGLMFQNNKTFITHADGCTARNNGQSTSY